MTGGFDRLVALCDERLRVMEEQSTEIERLRQGIWQACIALGMDTDGNDTPRHLTYPHLADLIVEEATRMRADYEAMLDSDDAEWLRSLITAWCDAEDAAIPASENDRRIGAWLKAHTALRKAVGR